MLGASAGESQLHSEDRRRSSFSPRRTSGASSVSGTSNSVTWRDSRLYCNTLGICHQALLSPIWFSFLSNSKYFWGSIFITFILSSLLYRYFISFILRGLLKNKDKKFTLPDSSNEFFNLINMVVYRKLTTASLLIARRWLMPINIRLSCAQDTGRKWAIAVKLSLTGLSMSMWVD